jgi:hypothetical protein
MRLGPLIAAGFAGALLGGCGGDDPPPAPQKPVRLTIATPVDTAIVQGSTATVTGTVSPANARVKVQGQAAQVTGGTFSAGVKLSHGANVIDVAATASGRAAALTAFRITREERVAVPDFVGLSAGDAEQQAKQRGLELESERGGGFLDSLVPRGIHVCEQEPEAGTRVRRGTTVRLLVARSC